MTLSYWEYKNWFTDVDFTIVGSGIVGLSCAIRLRELYPKANICILEKGVLPQGASTKNAGFACFGSLSELVDDLNSHPEDEVLNLVKKRWTGLELVRKQFSDKQIGYKTHGGFELFLVEDRKSFDAYSSNLENVNKLLKTHFKAEVFRKVTNAFGFNNKQSQLFYNPFEGQLNTAKLMQCLLQEAYSKGIKIINNCALEEYSEALNGVNLKTSITAFHTKRLFLASNGFAKQFLNEDVRPARAQVLITKPIKNLAIKGTFHLDRGYYYFRNINNRILLGGGRHLDFKTEETPFFGETAIVQNQLEKLLDEVILPNTAYEIDYRWSGIMGVGQSKSPIVKATGANVFAGVRLGGMGIAIGNLVGKELAELSLN